MFAKFWAAIILILPFYLRITHAADSRIAKDLFLSLAVILSAIIFGTKKINIKFSLALGLLAFLGFFVQHDQYSITVILQFYSFSLGIFLIIQGQTYFEDKDEKIILNALFITGLLQSFWVLINVIGFEPYLLFFKMIGWGHLERVGSNLKPVSKDYIQPIIGSLANPNLSSGLIALTFPSFLRGRKWLFILFPISSLFFLKSMGGILAAGFALLFYGLHRKFGKCGSTKIFPAVLLLFAAFFLVFKLNHTHLFADSERFIVWEKAVSWVFKENPIFGKGLGAFADLFYSNFKGEIRQHFGQAHNEFIEGFVAFGIVGSLIIFSLLLAPLKNLEKSPLIFACFVSALINATVNFTLHISSLALPFIIIYSFLTRNQESDNGIFSNKGLRVPNRRKKISAVGPLPCLRHDRYI